MTENQLFLMDLLKEFEVRFSAVMLSQLSCYFTIVGRNKTVGILTSEDDWRSIMGDDFTVSYHKLWYNL